MLAGLEQIVFEVVDSSRTVAWEGQQPQKGRERVMEMAADSVKTSPERSRLKQMQAEMGRLLHLYASSLTPTRPRHQVVDVVGSVLTYSDIKATNTELIDHPK